MNIHDATEQSYKNGYARGYAEAMVKDGAMYAIVSGVYSDWSIVGYCASLEEAYEYCAAENRGYYPIKVGRLIPSAEKSPAYVYYYEFTFRKRDGSWTPDEYDECLAEILHEKPSDMSPRINRSSPNCAWPFIKVGVYRKKLDVSVARKIAQDYLYKYLAEQEGL